jgi:hypothetical protein
LRGSVRLRITHTRQTRTDNIGERPRALLSRGLVTGKRAALLSLSRLCGRVCIILRIAAGFHERNIAPNLDSLEEVPGIMPRDCGTRRYGIP